MVTWEIDRPCLIKFKEVVREAKAIPGYYSNTKDVWVIEDASNIMPDHNSAARPQACVN